LREYFRLSYDQLPQSIDLVIVAKKNADSLGYEGVVMEMQILKAEHLAQSTSCLKK
jgi:RNase P protein component